MGTSFVVPVALRALSHVPRLVPRVTLAGSDTV